MSKSLYETRMAEAEAAYGPEGAYAFEACCFTEAELAKLTKGAVDMRVGHALQDMGMA
jgi:hypothetical protein